MGRPSKFPYKATELALLLSSLLAFISLHHARDKSCWRRHPWSDVHPLSVIDSGVDLYSSEVSAALALGRCVLNQAIAIHLLTGRDEVWATIY